MRVKFLGAAGEVTGSCYLVSNDLGEQLLIDCGMFQGEESMIKNQMDLEVNVDELTGVLLTHAHLDHCGRMPVICKDRKGRGGYDGNVYATNPTIDLAELVMRDAAKIAKDEFRRGERTRVMYGSREVDRLMRLFRTVEYRQEILIGRGFKVSCFDAGHILGSASILIEADGKKILFSGDLGNEPSPLVREIDVPEEALVVIMESTYGDRLHPQRGEELILLEDACKEIYRSGGTLLIPAFSLERTQEILHFFDHLKKTNLVANDLRVFVDSPMAMRSTEIFRDYNEYFNEEMRKHFLSDDPFSFEGLVEIETSRISKALDHDFGAKVIIAGSGMMNGGRIVGHAKRWLGDEKTILLQTGFQAVGTLGRELSEGKTEVYIDGRRIKVKAKVMMLETLSAHADQGQLLSWLYSVKGVREVVLTHGEDASREALSNKIKGYKVSLPFFGDELSF